MYIFFSFWSRKSLIETLKKRLSLTHYTYIFVCLLSVYVETGLVLRLDARMLVAVFVVAGAALASGRSNRSEHQPVDPKTTRATRAMSGGCPGVPRSKSRCPAAFRLFTCLRGRKRATKEMISIDSHYNESHKLCTSFDNELSYFASSQIGDDLQIAKAIYPNSIVLPLIACAGLEVARFVEFEARPACGFSPVWTFCEQPLRAACSRLLDRSIIFPCRPFG